MVSLGQELWILKLTCLSRKKRKKRKGFVYEKLQFGLENCPTKPLDGKRIILWSFSFSLVCAALKREVLDVKLSRFHPRNVKEKRSKMLCLGKYRLGIKRHSSYIVGLKKWFLKVVLVMSLAAGTPVMCATFNRGDSLLRVPISFQ